MEEIKINIDDETSDSELIKPKATRKPRAQKVVVKKTVDDQEQWALDQIKETKRQEQEVLISKRIQEALDQDRIRRPVKEIEVKQEKKIMIKKIPEPEPESESESESEGESEEESEESEPELTKKQIKAIRLQLEKKKQKQKQKIRKKHKSKPKPESDSDSDSDDTDTDDEPTTISRPRQFNISDLFF